MNNFIITLQIIVGILLIISVLLQSSSGGLGAALGGSNAYHTKRGVEKSIFYLTIILSVLFTGISIIVLTI